MKKSLFVISILVVVFSSCSEKKKIDNTKIDLGVSGMPMPTERLQKLNSRYKIAFLPDGYPGKRLENGEIYTHALYGTYILKDYLYQYKRDSSKVMYDAIVKLADVSISKMVAKENSLIFYYQPCKEFGYHKKFYSSLAQSSYLIPLYKTYLLTNDEKYKEASQKVMNSLFIPVEKGGVALNMRGVYSIEEDPITPHGLILNGWLSALTSIKKYYELSKDTLSYNLLMKSLKTLPSIIHLYDCEEYANTFYFLKGPQKFMLQFNNGNVSLKDIYVDNKNGNRYRLKPRTNLKGKEKLNYIYGNDLKIEGNEIRIKEKGLLINTILNRISFPVKNEIVVTINNYSKDNSIKVNRLIYNYIPEEGVVETKDWVKDTTIHLKQGLNIISIKPKWENLNLIGYPTTFKQFGNKYHNVYHYIHIDRLIQLNELLKNDTLNFYIEKWQDYTIKWPTMKVYDGVNYEPYN